MKRYAGEEGKFRQRHKGKGRRRFCSSILAFGLTALMTATAVLEPFFTDFGGQGARAAEVQSEICRATRRRICRLPFVLQKN